MIIRNFEDALSLLRQRAPANISRPAYMLEHMRRFMAYIDNPQDKLKVIHVAGTSGKTSTSYYIASLLHESGKKVGLSVSPFVHTINERVQVDLLPLPEAEFCKEFAIFMGIVEESDIPLSMFETLTAFAYWEFARCGVDYAVIEVGLGGEFDATNVVNRPDKVSVITDIGLDHQRQLGSTLSEIAQTKSAIIQFRNVAVVRHQDQAVLQQIQMRARHRQADLHTITEHTLPRTFDFLPQFQQRNFTLAQAVAEVVYDRDGIASLGEGALLRAARVSVPARMEVHSVHNKTVIFDGAHNEQKLQALASSLRHRYLDQDIAVLAAFKAKQHDRVEAATRALARFASHAVATSYGKSNSNGEPYGEDPNVIAALCKIHGLWSVETCSKPAQAWHQLLRRPEKILVVTGSLYMFNDMYPLLRET